MTTDDLFRQHSVMYLRDTYLPRIQKALEILPEASLWQVPHVGVPSVGNLLLHLSGNVRQWIVCGIGGEPDQRERAQEFAAPEQAPATQLLERLAETVRAAAVVIESVRDAEWETPRSIQGFEVTTLEAVYHVVEHFSWHTGQIVWMAKAAAGDGHGLAFYDEDAINKKYG